MPVFDASETVMHPALSKLLSVLFTPEIEFKPNETAQCKGLSMIMSNPILEPFLLRDGPSIRGQLHCLQSRQRFGERVAIPPLGFV